MNTPTVTAACEAIETLRAAVNNLSHGSRKFATDLIMYYERHHRLTDRQAPWVGKLITQAADYANPTDQTRAVSIGDVSGIRALFDKAAIHLKAPSVVMEVKGLGLVRVYVGKGNTRYAGRTMVADFDKPYPQGQTYGEIDAAGQFVPKKFVNIPTPLLPTLRDFACDPVKYARAYGILTGKCCFCRNRLTDPRSTVQGYGPDCAEHFELPWGELPEDGSLFLADENRPDQGAMDLTGLATPRGDETPVTDDSSDANRHEPWGRT